MKKVLIITYYWPPSGGAGVQRWLKFVKYFREFGWEPVVYTPENPEAPAIDMSLEKDIPENLTVIKTKIWEPYSVYKKLVGIKPEEKIKAGFLSENKKPSLIENISVKIRGNFFIPDARKFWIKPSIRFLTKYLHENPVEAIVSTGPPHSMHMIALGLKKKLNIPWLADFRDPWTNIDFYEELKLSKLADNSHRQKEKQVLKYADKLTTVSWNWAKDFERLGAKNVEVVTNGFDPDDFDFVNNIRGNTDKFEICHIGSMNKDRNPYKFWDAIAEICKRDNNFASGLKISFIGQTDISVRTALENKGLIKYAVFESYKPHSEVLKIARRASVLLLALNDTPNVEGIIPGKLFEYIALCKPVFCVGTTTGDSSKVIKETLSGTTIGFNEKEKMVMELERLFANYKNNSLEEMNNSDRINKYSRKSITSVMAKLLDDMLSR